MFKFATTLAVLGFLSVPAHAMVQTELTACTTPIAMETFTKALYFDHGKFEEVMPLLNKDGEVCKLTYRVFEPQEVIKTLEYMGMTYEVIKISVMAEGEALGSGLLALHPKDGTLYAMRYYRTPGTNL